jgi:hypothetical protein
VAAGYAIADPKGLTIRGEDAIKALSFVFLYG